MAFYSQKCRGSIELKQVSIHETISYTSLLSSWFHFFDFFQDCYHFLHQVAVFDISCNTRGSSAGVLTLRTMLDIILELVHQNVFSKQNYWIHSSTQWNLEVVCGLYEKVWAFLNISFKLHKKKNKLSLLPWLLAGSFESTVSKWVIFVNLMMHYLLIYEAFEKL